MSNTNPSSPPQFTALAEQLERTANNALTSAQALWGWRGRDKTVSRAFGALSRDLRDIAAALRTKDQS